MTQEYIWSQSINLSNWVFGMILDPDDMLTLYRAKKILKLSPFIEHAITTHVSINMGASLIFMTVNLANVAYKCLYATWFMNLLASVSGIKKLYKTVIQNPILGIFFYLSFYFRFLCDTDKVRFNAIANGLNIPVHGYITENLEKTISEQLTGEDFIRYKPILKFLSSLMISQVANQVEKIPSKINIGKMLEYIIQSEAVKFQEIKDPAVYIKPENIETQRDLDEFNDFVIKNKRAITNQVKSAVGGKKKYRKKTALQKIVGKRSPSGETMCLDKCKERVKTVSSCFCEGDCGTTTFLGGTSWCYVDPDKCKHGKHLQKFMGKTYSQCTSKNVKQPTCFTGLKYEPCKIKS